jgi:hypothetical protein
LFVGGLIILHFTNWVLIHKLCEPNTLRSFFIFPITICRTERLICNTNFERIANRRKGRKCAIIFL